MKSNIIGVNSEKLKSLILEIYDYRDKISKILDDSSILIDSTSEFYSTNDGDEMRKKFKKYEEYFTTFLTNIENYGKDLEVVLTNFKNNSEKSIDLFTKE